MAIFDLNVLFLMRSRNWALAEWASGEEQIRKIEFENCARGKYPSLKLDPNIQGTAAMPENQV